MDKTNDEKIVGENYVKITKNSKGYNWEVKVYDEDIDKASKKTIKIEKSLNEQYGE